MPNPNLTCRLRSTFIGETSLTGTGFGTAFLFLMVLAILEDVPEHYRESGVKNTIL